MKKDTLTEIKEMKMKEKKKQKKNFDINLLELILTEKMMIFLLKLVKYRITLLNQLKTRLKNQLKNH